MNTRGMCTAGLTAALIVIMIAPPEAQVRVAAARPSGAVAAEPVEHLDLLVGRSTVLRTERPIKRVSVPSPDVADALVTSPYEVLIHGKSPGTISLLIWGDTGQIKTYDVSVRRDLGELEERVRQLFPGEPITVSSNGADVVLSGIVTSKYVVDKAASLASGYVEKADNVVNLLRQQEGVASNQILLRVRFAEVSRTAVQELGASFFTGPGGYKDWLARVTTQQFPAPDFDNERGLVFSDFLNLLAFNAQEQLGTVIRALQTRGLFQSLAEPNLVTQNGREASFLAGGEFPVPILQGSGVSGAVTIMFKEFGVRLRFTPTVVGNELIHLKVAPEVSALDFANAVTVEGFRVPALSTRRTETEVELRDGQTFAIAGLIDNSVTQTMSKVPGLGDIPILGLLFRSRAYQKNATELVVMITPHILRRDSTGVTPDLPAPVEPFLPPPARRRPLPPPAFTTPPDRGTAAAAPAVPVAVAPAAPAVPVAVTPAAPAVPVAVTPAAPVVPLSVTPAARVADTPKAQDTREERKALERERKALERARKEAEQQQAREAAALKVERRAAERREAEEARAKAKQAKADAAAARRQAEVDRKQEAARAREQAKADAQRTQDERRQAELDRKQAERDRKLAEAARKAAEQRAREQGEIDRKRFEQERKLAEINQKRAEKLAKGLAKREAELAEGAARIEAARQKEQRKRAEDRRKREEELAKQRPRYFRPDFDRR